MGTWNASSFDNDDAQDWLAELVDTNDPEMIGVALSAVTEADGYVEALEAQQAVAAAEIVAAMNGRPADDLPDEAAEWAGQQGQWGLELIGPARRAVERVRTDSELAEMWEEEGSGEWDEMMRDLVGRLTR